MLCPAWRGRPLPAGQMLPPAVSYREDNAQLISGMDIRYDWAFDQLPQGSVVLADTPEPSLPAECPAWRLHITAEGGSLSINGEEIASPMGNPVHRIGVHTSATFLPATLLHMPDGTIHPQYHLLLRAEMQSRDWLLRGERCIILTELVLDPHDGTADTVRADVPAEDARELPYRRDFYEETPTGLPTRFCGSAPEQALQRYLYLLCAMHHAESVRRLLPVVRSRGQLLVDTYADNDKSFPECWGCAAETAEENHRRILPYLLRLRDCECFDSAELADFINSPLFGRLFGDEWK